jgi:hypothetical protein
VRPYTQVVEGGVYRSSPRYDRLHYPPHYFPGQDQCFAMSSGVVAPSSALADACLIET